MSPADELEEELREIGAERYHDRHPFHHLLHGGRLDAGAGAGLGAQPLLLPGARFRRRTPIIVARLPTPALRREWRRRLIDHDGDDDRTGGIARWLRLAEGLGLDRDYVVSTAGLLPATRFAVDAYVNFVRDRSLLEAVASCLTEMFSPQIIAERVEGMLRNYDFVTRETLAYFTPRLTQAPTRCRLSPWIT